MNSPNWPFLAGASLILTLGGIKAEPAPVMRDAATHDRLVLTLRKAEQNDPTRQLKPSTGEDPAVANRPGDLLSRSDIICFGNRATLVPKRAILHLPPKLAERLKLQQGAQFVPWPEFLAQNRAWISTVEVTLAQAEGSKALPDEMAASYHKSSNLVVATHNGGPISVLPLKDKPLTASVKP